MLWQPHTNIAIFHANFHFGGSCEWHPANGTGPSQNEYEQGSPLPARIVPPSPGGGQRFSWTSEANTQPVFPAFVRTWTQLGPAPPEYLFSTATFSPLRREVPGRIFDEIA